MSTDTKLFLTTDDAMRLWKELAGGQRTDQEFKYCFDENDSHPQSKLGATLVRERVLDGMYVLIFRNYLPEMPALLVAMRIEPVKVQFYRTHNAATRAKAGFYNDENGFTALVENFASDGGQAYSQNITVTAPTLELAQELNSALSAGELNGILVNCFE